MKVRDRQRQSARHLISKIISGGRGNMNTPRYIQHIMKVSNQIIEIIRKSSTPCDHPSLDHILGAPEELAKSQS